MIRSTVKTTRTGHAKTLSYHREDLRRDLLDAAERFIAEQGHDRLPIRRLAELVGVSPAAPYHHFPDRAALLIALAQRGFEQLTEAGTRVEGATSTPIGRLEALGHAFIDFCRANPGLFQLMYDSELTRPSVVPALDAEYRAGFERITQAFRAAIPDASEAALRERVVSYWSTIYGFACLCQRSMLSAPMIEPLGIAGLQQAIVRTAVGG